MARTVHELSNRRNKPFVAINCAAIPETLIESELFGHERGAFTGATERRLGCFELADGGTLFLDEIGEMDSDTQAKLLRVLQEGTFRRVGGGKGEIQVDVRVVAATNRVPTEAITAGQLREDLFYRLNVFSIHLPAAARAGGGHPAAGRAPSSRSSTARTTVRCGASAAEAEKELERYRWPGNVRELRNVIQRAVVLSGTGIIGAEHLPDNVLRVSGTTPAAADGGSVTPIREMERDMILRALEETGQDKRKAAQLLGISLKTLYNKLAKYGIQAVKSARLTLMQAADDLGPASAAPGPRAHPSRPARASELAHDAPGGAQARGERRCRGRGQPAHAACSSSAAWPRCCRPPSAVISPGGVGPVSPSISAPWPRGSATPRPPGP